MAAVAAVGVMIIGAGSASATILCHSYNPYDNKCPIADRYQVGEEIQGIATTETKLTDMYGFVGFSCKESQFNQVVTRNNASGTLEPALLNPTSLTFGSCTGFGGSTPHPVATKLEEGGIVWEPNTLDGWFNSSLRIKTYVGMVNYECEYAIAEGHTDAFNQSLVFKKSEAGTLTSGCPKMYFTTTYRVWKPLWVNYK